MICPKCREEMRMTWIGYPPEPFGDVCGCEDIQKEYEQAKEEVSESWREHLGYFDD